MGATPEGKPTFRGFDKRRLHRFDAAWSLDQSSGLFVLSLRGLGTRGVGKMGGFAASFPARTSFLEGL
jgi:hypothetical protein